MSEIIQNQDNRGNRYVSGNIDLDGSSDDDDFDFGGDSGDDLDQKNGENQEEAGVVGQAGRNMAQDSKKHAQDMQNLLSSYNPKEKVDTSKYKSFKGKNKDFTKQKNKPSLKENKTSTGKVQLTREQRERLERQDIGEAAEWQFKTLNRNYKGSDDEEMDSGEEGGGSNSDDDFEFDAILDNKEPPQKKVDSFSMKSGGGDKVGRGNGNLPNKTLGNIGKDYVPKYQKRGIITNSLSQKAKELREGKNDAKKSTIPIIEENTKNFEKEEIFTKKRIEMPKMKPESDDEWEQAGKDIQEEEKMDLKSNRKNQ